MGTAPAAPLKNCQGSDAGRKGPPSLLQSRVPGAPKPGPGSAQDGAKRAPRMEKPVLTKPTGAGAGEHGPAGPGAPTGVRGRGGGGGEPPSDRAGALSTRKQSRPGEALPSHQEEGACAACGASTLGRSPPLPARTGSACVPAGRTRRSFW